MRRTRHLTGAIALVGLLAACGSTAASPETTVPATTRPAVTSTTVLSITDSTTITAPSGDTVIAAAFTQPGEDCAAEGEPEDISVADGPIPTLEVRAESAESPLPDLAIRRLNCGGGWVNFRNELPSDRPVLFWIWGPT